MKYIKGAISISVASATVGSLIVLATPIFFFANMKETNAIQDLRIATLEEDKREMKGDIKEIAQRQVEANQKLDALLLKQGLNPTAVTRKTNGN